MAYNMTNFTAANNPYEMFAAVNSAGDNILSYMLILVMFVIVLFSLLKNNPPAESFAGASTVIVIASLMFLLADLINIVWMVGTTLVWMAAAVNLMNTS